MVVDLAEFDLIVEQALDAFGRDSSYAVSMASKASSIIAKRHVWLLRKELRSAEQRARCLCVLSEIHACAVSGPCGTGSCPFAQGDLRQLTPTPATSGKPVPRPVPSVVPRYNIEDVIRQLVAMRSGGRALGAVGIGRD